MKILLITFIGLLLAAFTMSHEGNRSEASKIVHKILNETAKTIERKHGIRACGTGIAMPGGIVKEFALSFVTESPYTKEQLRGLLVECANELLNAVNVNLEVRPYLQGYPFTLKNIQIIIFNHETSGRTVVDPGISVAEIAVNGLNYQSVDPDDHFRYKSDVEETYEEALKILQIE